MEHSYIGHHLSFFYWMEQLCIESLLSVLSLNENTHLVFPAGCLFVKAHSCIICLLSSLYVTEHIGSFSYFSIFNQWVDIMISSEFLLQPK